LYIYFTDIDNSYLVSFDDGKIKILENVEEEYVYM